jgi:hypothetical protein
VGGGGNCRLQLGITRVKEGGWLQSIKEGVELSRGS